MATLTLPMRASSVPASPYLMRLGFVCRGLVSVEGEMSLTRFLVLTIWSCELTIFSRVSRMSFLLCFAFRRESVAIGRLQQLRFVRELPLISW